MSATERKRRQRRREADGLIVAPVEVPHEMIAVLIDLGRLKDEESEDRAQIGKAIVLTFRELFSDHYPKNASRVDRQIT